MRPMENWQQVADTLGFKDEQEMLKHLYSLQGFSLGQMKQVLGFCTWSIRRRLIEYGIPLRGRGGPKGRLGRRLLKNVSQEDLDQLPARDIAAKYQVHQSTVYAEIKFREREKKNELCQHHANQLLSRLGAEDKVPHGISSVLQEPEV